MDSGELDLLMSMIAEPEAEAAASRPCPGTRPRRPPPAHDPRRPPAPRPPAAPPPRGPDGVTARGWLRRGRGRGRPRRGPRRARGRRAHAHRRTGKQLSVRPTTHPPRAVDLRGKRTAIVGDSPRIASHRARNGPRSSGRGGGEGG